MKVILKYQSTLVINKGFSFVICYFFYDDCREINYKLIERIN